MTLSMIHTGQIFELAPIRAIMAPASQYMKATLKDLAYISHVWGHLRPIWAYLGPKWPISVFEGASTQASAST